MARKNRQAKKMAKRGKSAEQIKAKTGVGSAAAQRYVKKSSSSPTTTTSSTGGSTKTTPKPKGVTQALRIAGGDGISKKDLKTIQDAGNSASISPGKIVGKLDKLNEKLVGKDKAGIRLKSGTANMLIKKGIKSRSKDPFGALFGVKNKDFDFGTGAFGTALSERMGDPGSKGTWRQGQLTGVREAVGPSFLDKGMDLGRKGKPTVRDTGKLYEVPKRFLGGDDNQRIVDNSVGDVNDTRNNGNNVNNDDGTETETDPIIPEEEPIDTSASSGAGGLDLASWATSFKKARSARQKAGKGAQGVASQKKNPFKSWYS